MIGFDTNVLLRLISGDERLQQKAAFTYLKEHCSDSDPAWVSRTVVVELLWVLESRGEFSRERIAEMMERLLHTAELRVEDHDVVRDAIGGYRSGADFADALIAHGNRAAGCTATMTFDKRAAKRLPAFKLLE